MLNNLSNAGFFQINVGGNGTSKAEEGHCHPRALINRNTTLSDNRSVDFMCHVGIELEANDAVQQLLSSLSGHIRGVLMLMIEDLAIGVFTYNNNEVLGSLLMIIRHYTINVPVRTMLEEMLG